MRDYRQSIKQYLKKEIGVMLELDVAAINAAINALMDAREREANIYVFGNGGSAATASHFVCDFAKGCYEKLGAPKMRFHCLSDNTPTVSYTHLISSSTPTPPGTIPEAPTSRKHAEVAPASAH